jgi:hypothetical protein
MGAYNDDVLFIHIPKCGGWAVKKYMQEHLPNVLMPDNPEAKLPIGHVRLQDIERFTGRAPSTWKRIIAVVRNPYEQQLSQFTFWATRRGQGGTHIHDLVTGAYIDWPRVLNDCMPRKGDWEACTWLPHQMDLESWLQDPRSDFHVWYMQHHGYTPGMPADEQQQTRDTTIEAGKRYEDFGGMFRFWLTVDDEIPDNVCILRQENLGKELRNALDLYAVRDATDMVDSTVREILRQLPELPRRNTSSHPRPWFEYYTPLAARLVEQKCKWAFSNYYEKFLLSDCVA